MERVSAHTVSSTTFCLHSPSIKSRVHFFPSAGATTGPYSITCTFTLFGKGIEKRSIAVDGGRLSQPDGIRLEDAFAALRGDSSGIFGLTLELSCQQQRVNMLPSLAAIELVTPQSPIMFGFPRFIPVESAHEGGSALSSISGQGVLKGDEDTKSLDHLATKQGLALMDSFGTTSLIVVNPSALVVKPSLYRVLRGERVSLHVGTVAAESAVEIPLEESLLRDSSPFECTYGLLRAEEFFVDRPNYSEIASAHSGAAVTVAPGGIKPQAQVSSNEQPQYFLLQRDPTTKRPLSVSAI